MSSNLPQTLNVVVDGNVVEMPSRLAKPDPLNPTKPRNTMFEAKLTVPITSGRQIEDILDHSVVTFDGDVMKRGTTHLSQVNEVRNTGGNSTVVHTFTADIGGERPYQFRVTMTGIEKNGVPCVWINARATIQGLNVSTPVGSISAGASF